MKFARLLVLVLLIFSLGSNLSVAAGPPPSDKAQAVFKLEEEWESYNTGEVTKKVIYATEFKTIDEDFEVKYVSLNGNGIFRTRDPKGIKETIYSDAIMFKDARFSLSVGRYKDYQIYQDKYPYPDTPYITTFNISNHGSYRITSKITLDHWVE